MGTWAAAHARTVARIVEEGRDLGNHTWSRTELAQLAPGPMFDEIDRCANVLQSLTGSNGKGFRPSQIDVPTAAILTQAGRAGYTTSVGFDVDPLDYTDPGAPAIEERARSRLHAGAIVSLHSGTAEAFAPVVEAVRARGLEAVTVSTLLGRRRASCPETVRAHAAGALIVVTVRRQRRAPR